MHVGDGVVGGLEVGVADEAVAFAEIGLVACNLGQIVSKVTVQRIEEGAEQTYLGLRN